MFLRVTTPYSHFQPLKMNNISFTIRKLAGGELMSVINYEKVRHDYMYHVFR